jgi:hypothetical protein
MQAVHDNRLHHHAEQFEAPGALTYVDIITAPGQFWGFICIQVVSQYACLQHTGGD